jgi:hypothetical protein
MRLFIQVFNLDDWETVGADNEQLRVKVSALAGPTTLFQIDR